MAKEDPIFCVFCNGDNQIVLAAQTRRLQSSTPSTQNVTQSGPASLHREELLGYSEAPHRDSLWRRKCCLATASGEAWRPLSESAGETRCCVGTRLKKWPVPHLFTVTRKETIWGFRVRRV